MFHNDVRMKLYSNCLSFRVHVCTIITINYGFMQWPQKELDTLKMHELKCIWLQIGKLVEY